MITFWADFWLKIYEKILVSKSPIILPKFSQKLAKNQPILGQKKARRVSSEHRASWFEYRASRAPPKLIRTSEHPSMLGARPTPTSENIGLIIFCTRLLAKMVSIQCVVKRRASQVRDNFFTLILKYLLPAPWIH